MHKRKVRMTIDIAMTLLLPMLMAYSLIGEKFHEVAGTLMLILFIVHNWLNRGFWKGLTKGKYNTARTFRTVINVALLIAMILQPLSGIVMSKHLYTFLPALGISAKARQVHLVLAYWTFVLMCIHAGTHFDMMFGKIKKENAKIAPVLLSVFGAISAYGIYAFIKRKFRDYMFLKTAFVFFDFAESRIFFFLDYIAVMILFMIVGYLAVSALGKVEKKTNPPKEI